MVTKTATKTTTRPAKPAASATPVKTAKSAQPALAKPLTGDQVIEMFTLIKGATSVELKLSVPLESHHATVRSIGLDPVEAQPRQASSSIRRTWP